MKISVGMTTYNSERYLKEQLDSIMEQTMLPNEIVICDDGSTDNSVACLNEYFEALSGISVKIIENEKNLGYAKNFEKCYQICTGDIIISSDADDKWFPEKVEKLVKCFSDSSVVYAFHDAIKIDSDNNIISGSMYSQAGMNWNKSNEDLLKQAIKRQGFPLGMTMAFRSNLLEKAVPFYFAHDEWIWICALLVGSVRYINEPLTYYRRHGHNTSGSNGESIYNKIKNIPLRQWFDWPTSYIRSYNQLRERFFDDFSEAALKELDMQIDFRKQLTKVVEASNKGKALVDLWSCYGTSYQKYRGGWHTLVVDMLKVLYG